MSCSFCSAGVCPGETPKSSYPALHPEQESSQAGSVPLREGCCEAAHPFARLRMVRGEPPCVLLRDLSHEWHLPPRASPARGDLSGCASEWAASAWEEARPLRLLEHGTCPGIRPGWSAAVSKACQTLLGAAAPMGARWL